MPSLKRHYNRRIGKNLAVSRRKFLQTTLAGFGAAAAGIRLNSPAMAAEDPKLNFYNWDTYIGETTLDDFEDETGIRVNLSLFSDNDELFAKLKAGNPGFDVIVPSGDFTNRMIQTGIVQAIDHSKIPNIKNIDPLFMDAPFDRGRKYSLCYMWGTTGIGYRKSRVDGVPTWTDIFDSDKYSGRIALFDATVTLHMVSKYLGNGMNPSDPKLIEEAVQLMIKQKPHVKVYHDDNGQDLLASGEVDLVHEYNGDIAQLQLEDDDIAYVIPEIGGEIWQDNLAIPTGAPHPENAHAFINYILDAEVGATIADYIQYATPNIAARALMDDSYKNNPIIFPEERLIVASEMNAYHNETVERYLSDGWTRVRA